MGRPRNPRLRNPLPRNPRPRNPRPRNPRQRNHRLRNPLPRNPLARPDRVPVPRRVGANLRPRNPRLRNPLPRNPLPKNLRRQVPRNEFFKALRCTPLYIPVLISLNTEILVGCYAFSFDLLCGVFHTSYPLVSRFSYTMY